MQCRRQPCTTATLRLTFKHSCHGNPSAHPPSPPSPALAVSGGGGRLHAGSRQAHGRHADKALPTCGRNSMVMGVSMPAASGPGL